MLHLRFEKLRVYAVVAVVNVTVSDGVAVVEMDDPARMNAMGTMMLEELVNALAGASADPRVGAVVLTGAGSHFSSGADLNESLGPRDSARRMQLFCNLYERVTGFPKPTIAAMAGHCIGGGAEVAAGCDLRVGDATCSIRFPGAQFGIPVGSARLEALIGLSHAKDLLMTSRTVGSEDAFRIGLLNRLTSGGRHLDESVVLARKVSENPGAVTQKRQLDEATALSSKVARENRALIRWERSR